MEEYVMANKIMVKDYFETEELITPIQNNLLKNNNS